MMVGLHRVSMVEFLGIGLAWCRLMAHRKSVIKVVDFNVSYQVYVLIIRMFFIASCVQCVDG